MTTVDPAFRSRLREVLYSEDNPTGMTQRELARRIGTTPATISNLVGGRHPQARRTIVAAICGVFRWPIPADRVASDEAYHRIVEAAPHLTPEQRLAVAQLIDSFKIQR